MAADGARAELMRAGRAILRPLIRLFIAHGLTYPAFNRLVREVYIEVGTKYFSLPFKKQTDSRVALVTGIPRKEIGQIRRGQSPALGAAVHLDYGVATRVVGRWVGDERYRDAAGNPRALPYEPSEGQPSFVAIVDEVGGDIPPRAVLDELIRVGAVALSPRGDVRLKERAYIPARGTEEKLVILGGDAGELISAIAHNIDAAGDDAFLQRKVYYDNIGAEALRELRQRVREDGGGFVQKINTLLASYDRDRNPRAPGGVRTRVAVGVYYLEEEYEPPPAPPEPVRSKG